MSTQSRSDLFKLFDLLNAESYKINPLYVDMTGGSLVAGFLLTQLIFLARNFGYEEFYRTDEQLREAYRLGPKELINARKTLSKYGFVDSVQKKTKASILRKWHYTINIDKIVDAALELPAFQHKQQPQEEAQRYSPKRRQVLAETATSTRRNGDINNDIHNDLNNKKKDLCAVSGSDKVNEVFHHWQKVMNHPKAVLDKKRKRHLEEALAKYSVDELKQAIDGCASNEWYMGKNDRGTVFDAIHVIFKDSDKIEGFIRMAFVKPKPIPTKSDYHQNVSNAFANVMLELSCVGGLAHGAV